MVSSWLVDTGVVGSRGHRYYRQRIPFFSLPGPLRWSRQRTPNESHTTRMDSRNESVHPDHLNRAWPGTGPTANGTSSRQARVVDETSRRIGRHALDVLAGNVDQS